MDTISPNPNLAHSAPRRILDFLAQPTRSLLTNPPISIPRTPSFRLETATHLKSLPDHHLLPSSSPLAAPYLADPSTSTVLYLAYGSNLSAETFLGRRGIRPISAINVSAPTLQLTFDLPGIPYLEPCFANTAPLSHTRGAGSVGSKSYGDPIWNKGLVGVVYEVTPEDYATIIKIEGGGASYQDILVPCVELPASAPGIPEKPPVSKLPTPFLAHTLYAPRLPKKRDGDSDGHGGREDDTPLDRVKNWWRDLLLEPPRPDPDYGQPSARYLKLIIDGAAEHNLPAEYQRWLQRLQSYTSTSRKQNVGKLLFLLTVTPFLRLCLALGRVLADDRGNWPLWLALTMEIFLRLIWRVYDCVFKPLFGDGERTMKGEGEGGRRGRGAVDMEKGRLGKEVE